MRTKTRSLYRNTFFYALTCFLASCSGAPGARDSSEKSKAESTVAPATTFPKEPILSNYAPIAGQIPDAGTLEVVVTWNDLPREAIASPGVDGCGNAVPGPVPFHIREKKQTVNGLRAPIVWLEGIGSGKDFPKETRRNFYIRNCQIEPRVATVSTKTKQVLITNLDERAQTLTVDRISTSGVTTDSIISTRLAIVGSRALIELDAPGFYRLRIASQPFQDAFLYVSQTPYAAVPDADGLTALFQVPQGTYRLRAWHPPLTPSSSPLATQKTIDFKNPTRIHLPLRGVAVDQ